MPISFVSKATLAASIEALRATADPMLKVWFTLKCMGLTEESPVLIDTSNSDNCLDKLFGYSGENYFVPFADTNRALFMALDAARSQIQTNIKKFHDQTVAFDPRAYLKIGQRPDTKWEISCQPAYPQGLGYGTNGFARGEGQQVVIPLKAWSMWFGRQTNIPDGVEPTNYLVERMLRELKIDPAERAAIFRDDSDFQAQFEPTRITADELRSLVLGVKDGPQPEFATYIVEEQKYLRKLASVRSNSTGPKWLNLNPTERLKKAVERGEKAVLLYGAPRTGKTKAIDDLVARTSTDRATIQIHDGWSYEHLVLGIKSTASNSFDWTPGPLLRAIREGKKYIVLEEANRTLLSQALGEIFSLLEVKYRGESNSIVLRDGSDFSIPVDAVFIFSMNTLDNSTEEVDDALLGRVSAIEFPPRVESLRSILAGNSIKEERVEAISEFFAGVQSRYPLGHGYFADVTAETDLIGHYLNHIRPVLQKRFRHETSTMASLDLLADEFLRHDR